MNPNLDPYGHVTIDAENPPASAPTAVEGVMGYLGGPRATRVWTLGDWVPFGTLKQYGIYVPDIGANPLSQGREAVQLALALGWSDKFTGAQQRAIIIDMETSANAAFYDKIATEISTHGFAPVAYGSLSTVLGNAADDVLAADWDDKAVIPPGQTVHGCQYLAQHPFKNTVIDYSVIDDWLYQRGGVGPRHKVA
jgi:hypothetical protein